MMPGQLLHARTDSSRSERDALIVLGMHRSGTSAMSGLLQVLGCDGPKTPMEATDTNPKGYFESAPIFRLHDEILVSAGSNWHDYRPFDQTWLQSAQADGYRNRLRGLIESEFGKSKMFIVKDPRICRFLNIWTDLLEEMGIRPLVVHIHRNPLEVARSLQARDKFHVAYGQLLWLRHVLNAEAASRKLPRVFTSYEALISDSSGVTEKLGTSLDISWPTDPEENVAERGDMISPNLKHFQFSTDQVLQNPLISEWIRDTYAILEDWALHKEKPEDHRKLDRILEALDASAVMFGGLVNRKDMALAEERNAAQAQLKQGEARLAERTAAGDAVAVEHDAFKLSSTAIRQPGDRSNVDVIAHLEKLELQNKEIAALQFQLETTSAAMAEVEKWRRELEQDLIARTSTVKRLQAEAEQQKLAFDAQSLMLKEAVIASKTMQAKAENAETRLDNLNGAAETLTIGLQAQTDKVASFWTNLHRSTSWQLTRPLRWVARRVRAKYRARN